MKYLQFALMATGLMLLLLSLCALGVLTQFGALAGYATGMSLYPLMFDQR